MVSTKLLDPIHETVFPILGYLLRYFVLIFGLCNSQCVSKLYTAWNTAIRILFNVPRDTHRYLIESIPQCLHVKTMLASRYECFYETIKESSKLCIWFLSNLCKNDLGRNLFSIANDCSVNPLDLSKMLVKKQMKYFDIPLEHAWKVPVLQEL